MAKASAQEAVEGSFEGTYTGERIAGHEGEGRRYSLQLVSGRIVPSSASSNRVESDGSRILHQTRLRNVAIELPGAQGDTRATLYDVEVYDFTLGHPAERSGQSFGTIVGRVRARLRPPTPETASGAAPSLTATPAPPATRSRRRPPPRRPVHGRAVEGVDGERAWRRVRFSAALAMVALATGGVWLRCGRETALLYGVLCLIAILLRWVAKPLLARALPLQGPLTLIVLGGLCWGLLHPMEPPWLTGCAGGTALFTWGLALPMGVLCLAKRRWPLALAFLGFTLGVCLQCGALGVCALPAKGGESAATEGPPAPTSSATAPSASPRTSAGPPERARVRPPARTDASGRWPAQPGTVRVPSGGDPAVSLRARLSGWGVTALESVSALRAALGGADVEVAPVSPGLAGGAVGGDASALRHGALPQGALRHETVSLDPDSGATPNPPVRPPPEHRPGEGEATVVPAAPVVGPAGAEGTTILPARAASTRSAPGRPDGSSTLSSAAGGWVAPDHRQAEREVTLISVEQANRRPADFYASDGRRRVYLPTDAIFEPSAPRLRPGADVSLSRLAALLAAGSSAVVIEVHTDAGGEAQARQRLSEERAAVVAGWLATRGHQGSDSFRAVGAGARYPLVPPDGSWAAQQPNRRIEVRLSKTGAP